MENSLYYNILLERCNKTEAIDMLHLKIGCEMKKLLIFNRCDMIRNMNNV